MNKLLSLALVGFLAACGGGNNGGGAPAAPAALSKDQKARFENVLSSVGSTQNAAISAKDHKQGKAVFSQLLDTAVQTSDLETKMANDLAANCQNVKVTEPDANKMMDPMNQEFNYGMEVGGGANCPVELAIKTVNVTKMDPKAGIFKSEGSSESHFLVKSPKFADLNDAQGYDIKGKQSIEMKGTADGATMTGSGDMDGVIRSAKEGEIKITGKMTASGVMRQNDGETVVDSTITFQFKDMAVVIRMVEKENAKKEKSDEYYLNGEKMKEEDFKAMMAKGGPAMGGQPTDSKK